MGSKETEKSPGSHQRLGVITITAVGSWLRSIHYTLLSLLSYRPFFLLCCVSKDFS